MGIARALGVRFLDGDGTELPEGGGALEGLARIDASRLDERLGGTPIIAAHDVDAPLLGSDGAIAFAPQKGATPGQAAILERGLRRLAERLAADLGRDVAGLPGAGAAGGAGAMLAALGAELRPGAEVVLDALGFDDRLAGAQLAITGEGKLDAQTLRGKAPYAVERRCDAVLVACAAIVGETDVGPGETGFVAIRSLVEHFGDRGTAMTRAAEGLEAIASALVRSLAGSVTRP
jgi:glycerate kinase